MLSRHLSIPRQGTAVENLEHACSRWSIDTHSFAWVWGKSELSMEDVVILTPLSLRGASILDLAHLSREDRENARELRRLGKLAQFGPIFTTQGVRKSTAANAKKTSFASWIRYFFKDLQPTKTAILGAARDFVTADSPSPAVFPLAVLLARGEPVALAPLFLGSLYRQLDLVHADFARSLGKCGQLSMVHTSFLLAYFFEHFPIVAPPSRTFQASAARSRAEQWYGTSNDVSWYEACNVAANFTPRPYNSASPGVVGIGQCLLPVSSSLSVASSGDSVARVVINSTLIALPGWLTFLNNEASGVTVYRPDRFARQLSFDQGVLGAASVMPTFAKSQHRFVVTQISDILLQLGDLPIPLRDNVGHYTPEFHLFWGRNLNFFLTFVHGEASVPEVSEIRTQDTSLRAITEVRGPDWHGPHSQWAMTDAVPINRDFSAMPPPAPQAVERRAPARGAQGRTQPLASAGPSQPSSS
ncbi:hypothetical protein C3L33_02812, partial [Rhododendron williamsianum]